MPKTPRPDTLDVTIPQPRRQIPTRGTSDITVPGERVAYRLTSTFAWTLRGRPTDAPLKNAPLSGQIFPAFIHIRNVLRDPSPRAIPGKRDM